MAVKEFQYKNSELRIKYVACFAWIVDKKVVHVAYGKYELDATLETGVPMTLGQKRLLMDTFVPLQILTEMKNAGIINGTNYE